jgi:hypothetical protein
VRCVGCSLVLLAVGCFSGDATLGAVCRRDADCGGDQRCTNEICGRCGDGSSDPGEVCVGEAVAIDLGIAAERIAVVDLDRDAFGDLVASAGGEVVPLLGGGSGFVAGAGVAVEGVVGLHGGDIDGDGRGDVIAIASVGLVALFGDGAGGLAATTEVEASVQHVLVDPGRGVAVASGASVTLYAVQDDRRFVAGESVDVAAPMMALLGPLFFDGDALADIVVAREDGSVDVLLGTAEGYAVVPSDGFGEPIVLVAMFDVAGEAGGDLVAVTDAGRLVVRESDGEGTFLEGTSVDRSVALGANVTAIAGGDVNRDGEADVLVGTDDGVQLHLQRGGFLQPSTPLPGEGAFGDLVLTRFDVDLFVDVLAVEAGEIMVLRGDP